MLKQRIITAIILIPLVVISVLYLPPLAYTLVVSTIIFFAAWEYAGLFGWQYSKRVVFLMILMLFVLLVIFVPAILIVLYKFSLFSVESKCRAELYLLSATGVLWWLESPYYLWRYAKKGYKDIIYPMFFGIIIFVPCLASLFVLSRFETLLLLVIIWSADIGAYFIGKIYGKNLLVPQISPKKTLEGACGGVLLSLLATIVFNFLIFPHEVRLYKVLMLLVLSIIVSVWSIIGDLFESMLKRQAGTKDSGQLLPGHGGAYDRLDSLIAAAPVFTVGLLLISLLN